MVYSIGKMRNFFQVAQQMNNKFLILKKPNFKLYLELPSTDWSCLSSFTDAVFMFYNIC